MPSIQTRQTLDPTAQIKELREKMDKASDGIRDGYVVVEVGENHQVQCASYKKSWGGWFKYAAHYVSSSVGSLWNDMRGNPAKKIYVSEDAVEHLLINMSGAIEDIAIAFKNEKITRDFEVRYKAFQGQVSHTLSRTLAFVAQRAANVFSDTDNTEHQEHLKHVRDSKVHAEGVIKEATNTTAKRIRIFNEVTGKMMQLQEAAKGDDLDDFDRKAKVLSDALRVNQQFLDESFSAEGTKLIKDLKEGMIERAITTLQSSTVPLGVKKTFATGIMKRLSELEYIDYLSETLKGKATVALDAYHKECTQTLTRLKSLAEKTLNEQRARSRNNEALLTQERDKFRRAKGLDALIRAEELITETESAIAGIDLEIETKENLSSERTSTLQMQRKALVQLRGAQTAVRDKLLGNEKAVRERDRSSVTVNFNALMKQMESQGYSDESRRMVELQEKIKQMNALLGRRPISPTELDNIITWASRNNLT